MSFARPALALRLLAPLLVALPAAAAEPAPVVDEGEGTAPAAERAPPDDDGVGDAAWDDAYSDDAYSDEELEAMLEGSFEEVGEDGAVVVDEETGVESTTILGDLRARRRVAGSAHVIDEEELERFEQDDIHRVLQRVPGVYVRDEDGFGLRPNIGLRGANSDRSSRVTLLEDGVLLGPSPYSAPAAYYFPLTGRMVAVEVFKGPAAIRHGPQTVGGAVNLRTRRVPSLGITSGVDVAGGRFGTRRAQVYAGWGSKHIGLLVEGMHVGSTGFKHIGVGRPPRDALDFLAGNGTGFAREDVMLKARLSSGLFHGTRHNLTLKLGYGQERSAETYVGLSDVDFARDPYRRYAGTRLDGMAWGRSQVQLRYSLDVGAWLQADVVAYRHDFERSWTKLNRFRGGAPLGVMLSAPEVGQNAVYTAVLRGERDSTTSNEALMLGTNARGYVSQGVQADATAHVELGPVAQDVRLGARVHHDRVTRTHTERGYLMQNRNLMADGLTELVTADNTGESVALSAYVQDEVAWGPLLVVPGVRFEGIYNRFDDRLDDEPGDAPALRFSALPGIGLSWALLPELVAFGGVHRGFAPVAPGQAPEVEPEGSWNGEAGARWFNGRASAEVVGFANLYDNLVGTCTFSSGCDDASVGRQVNGGSAMVAGAEVNAGHRFKVRHGFELRGNVAYTFTWTRFLSSFSSTFPQWGEVKEGDELPYVPMHQLSLVGGVDWGQAALTASASWVSVMRDSAGQGEILPGQGTDPVLTVDVMASHGLGALGEVYFRATNVLGAQAVISRRPIGARPNPPAQFLLGYRFSY